MRAVPLVSASGKYGGPSDTALAQAKLVANADLSVVLVAGFLRNDRPYPVERANIRVELAPVRSMIPPLGFPALGSLKAVASLLRTVKEVDVAHISFSREFLPITAVLLCLVLRRPVILQPHGMLTARTSTLHRALDVIVRPLFRRSFAVIALTATEEMQLKRWCGHGMPRTVCIGNPVLRGETPAEPAPPEGALFLARLEPRKRVSDFAAAAVHAEKLGWTDHYSIVGPDQGDLAGIREDVAACKLLRYDGAVPGEHVPTRVGECRVFVLPSKDEPWGNVLVLALSLGKPVVVTRSAALAPDIEAFGAGIVVDDCDPAAIAHAVHELLADGSRRDRAIDGARQLSAEILNQESVRAKLQNEYVTAARWPPKLNR
ncbi:glycosyltransferase [Okibacterium sp. HSC-33S16]|uniref:glycosyltransferase n=1 Tax=Okibacterium sp. HSC-33S16 TaxID=2910965 RepID=UPI0035A944CA